MHARDRIWLTTFFAAGTIIWSETINGGSWQVSMLVAVLMTLLALNEVFGHARPFYVGLWAGLAALARYGLCLIWPMYLVLCAVRNKAVRGTDATSDAFRYPFIDTAAIWIGFGLAGIGYVAFNQFRYGTPIDVGLLYYNPLNGNLPVAQRPTLFALRYFPGNFFTLFYMAPTLM